MNDIVALKLTQPLRQHLLGRPRNQFLEFAEPVSLVLEMKQNQRFPFPTNDICRNFYWAVGFVEQRVSPDTRFQKGAYWRNGDFSLISGVAPSRKSVSAEKSTRGR